MGQILRQSEELKLKSTEMQPTIIRAIDRAGFATIPNVIEPDECAHVFESLNGTALNRSRAGVRHAMRYPILRALAEDSRVLDIARGILGEGAFPFRATLFDKSPTSNWLVAWHQDTALPMREKREEDRWGPWSVKEGVIDARAPVGVLSQIVALRIHLDDSTIENGPLRVLPGSHREGLLSDEEIHRLAAEVTAVECPVPRGGILAVRPLIVHASSKSRSEQSRRVLHVEYSPSQAFADAIGLAAP